MRFSVRHQTFYEYSAPVSLAAHTLRLTPRPDAGNLITRTLDINPAPISRQDSIDPFGNVVTRVGFAGASDRFVIDSRFEVDIAAATTVAGQVEDPAPYLGGAIDESVRAFARSLYDASGGAATTFLDRLNDMLFTRIRHDIRDDGAARPPEATLALGHGACRDLTLLFLAACHSLAIPARFVSGYQAHAETPDGRRHLHAWPQAFVEGWRGYDPTHGFAVTDGHVALSAAPDQTATMPVEGGFFANEFVSSKLRYQIDIATG